MQRKAPTLPSAQHGALARPRLICLGLSALDITWKVDALPKGAGKTRADDLHTGGGGMAANAAAAAARLGAEVHFWGRAGHDGAGHEMKAQLAALGVDVRQFRLFEGARSSVSGVVVDAQGERMIVNFRGADQPVDASWLPLEEVAQADAVLADPRWPEGASALFRAARAHGIPTVLDGDVADAAVFDGLLPHTDHAVFSEPGLAGYAPPGRSVEDRLRFVLAHGCRLAAVTLGAHGLVWADADGVQRLPVFPVHAVDTTGAGDVFHGALALGLGAGWPVRRALQFSAAVAAIKCTRPGGRAGVPDFATAISLLDHLKE
ncbi:sugar kinase [Verminephrobacter aporrectodeae subsp. tuberculatae]|uniref:PfkB family carbohydrate kinase n=1 Tax=Verminephrobacter aporrectodeae TaxID=1110389 RepID=UPI002238AA9E|nr:PfkB family carbohydrate kinase [Verminephrobacter aporrectodeae]MCW5256609.1 sugar kinase [Verminephrobacter aporrectodeae subsp. tuberculatae]